VEAMIFGPDLIAGMILLFIFWGIPIWAIVDAASRTTSSFKAAGSSKTLWITLIVVFMFVFAPIAIIIALVYLLGVRQKVSRFT
jgi:hypothetical protein